MNHAFVLLLAIWRAAATDSACIGGEESQSCIQEPTPRRGTSQIQVHDRGIKESKEICECAKEFEEKASLVEVEGKSQQSPKKPPFNSNLNVTGDWGWGKCAPWCRDNGCPCLKPWTERCEVKSCSECPECDTNQDYCKPYDSDFDCSRPTIAGDQTGCTTERDSYGNLASTVCKECGDCVDMPECIVGFPPAGCAQLCTGQLGTSECSSTVDTDKCEKPLASEKQPWVASSGCPECGKCKPRKTPEPTPAPPVPPSGVCMLAGDPHVKVFDVLKFAEKHWAAVDYYEAGDYWIVKTNDVKIQGRLVSVANRHAGNAMVEAIAISGDFINNNVLVIEDKLGKVTWNNDEKLPLPLPSTFTEPIFNTAVSATYHDEGTGLRNGVKPPATVDVDLPWDIQIKVNRFNDFIDIMITMHQSAGMDGLCGNFNDNVDDDKESALKARINYPDEKASEVLFSTPFPSKPSSLLQGQGGKKATTSSECTTADLELALRKCKEKMGAGVPEALLNSCAHDSCFVGDQFLEAYESVNDVLAAVTKHAEEKNEISKTCTGWCLYSEPGAKAMCKTDDGTTEGKINVADRSECEVAARNAGHNFFSFRMKTDTANGGLCITSLTCDEIDNSNSYNWQIYEHIGAATQVSCGGHTANTCAECGEGAEYCNGECEFKEVGGCVLKPPTYTDLGVGKCVVSGKDKVKHDFLKGQGSEECQISCNARSNCYGYTANSMPNCLLWLETGLSGGGADYAGGHCFVKA